MAEEFIGMNISKSREIIKQFVNKPETMQNHAKDLKEWFWHFVSEDNKEVIKNVTKMKEM